VLHWHMSRALKIHTIATLYQVTLAFCYVYADI